MELVQLETSKLDKMQAAIDLQYIEESGDFAAKYFPVQVVYINRDTWHILNPHCYQAMKAARPTAAEMPCLLVSVAAEDEIGTAIALAGGIDGLLAGRPATQDANKKLFAYILRTFNNEDTRNKLFGLGPDADYWLDLIEFLQSPETDTTQPNKPQTIPAPIIPLGLEADFPVIDINKQATNADVQGIEWTVWGSQARTAAAAALHFYTEDKRFATIFDKPEIVTATGATIAVEPNYSANEITPLPIALADIWKKRQLNKMFQLAGIKTVVDLNVPRDLFSHALYGVPGGWTAYANKYYRHDTEHLTEAYELAKRHAGTDDLLYIVFGSEGVKPMCEANNWIFVNVAWRG